MDELKEELQVLEDRLEELENCYNYGEYDNMLDEVGMNPTTYPPSMILKKVDPVSYRCGHNDYNDGLIREENEEIDDKKQEKKDETTT